MNKYEKLEWLRETCTQDFIENKLVDEMVRFLDENEFDRFYNWLCCTWGIARDQAEWDYLYCK